MIWVLVFTAYSYIAATVPDRRAFIAPDESNTFHIAEKLVDEGTIYIDSSLNERFGLEIFRGRHYAEVSENRYTAYNSIGLVLLMALAMKTGVTYFLIPFLASLAVIGVYLIVREIADEKAALLGALIFGLIPSNVYHANLIFDANPSFAMLLLSLGMIMLCLRRNSLAISVLAGFSLGMSFMIRQALAPYILLILVFCLCNIKRMRVRYWAAYICCAAIPAIFIMGVNKTIYGSFTSSGPTVTSGATTEALFPGLNFSAIAHTIDTYLVLFIPLLFICGLAGFILYFRRRRGWRQNTFILLMVAIFVLTLLMFGSRSRTYGFRNLLISGSIARYYLAIYTFLAIFAGIFLISLLMRGMRVAFTLILASMIISFSVLTFGSIGGIDGIQSMNARFKSMDEIEREMNELGDKVLILTKTTDKYFYPDIEIGLCYTEADIKANPNLKGRYPIVDPAVELLPVVDTLLAEGWRVFVAYDTPETIQAMMEGGYMVSPFNEVWGGLREVKENLEEIIQV